MENKIVNLFFDFFMTDVCLFWTLSLVVDIFFFLKKGQFRWKTEKSAGNLLKILLSKIEKGGIVAIGVQSTSMYFGKTC
jgi:hypothetical protein